MHFIGFFPISFNITIHLKMKVKLKSLSKFLALNLKIDGGFLYHISDVYHLEHIITIATVE